MPPKSSVKPIPVQYDPAETVGELAKDLIRQYHPHLATCKIAYLFKNKEIKSKGRLVVATTKKVSADMHALCGYHFLITIAYPTWNDLSDEIKRAALDHELEHCWVEDDEKTGETKYRILPHDVEEFGSVIQRHGLYTTNLVKLGSVVDNAEIPDNLSKETVVYKLGNTEAEPDGPTDSDSSSDTDDKPKAKPKSKSKTKPTSKKKIKVKKKEVDPLDAYLEDDEDWDDDDDDVADFDAPPKPKVKKNKEKKKEDDFDLLGFDAEDTSEDDETSGKKNKGKGLKLSPVQEAQVGDVEDDDDWDPPKDPPEMDEWVVYGTVYGKKVKTHAEVQEILKKKKDRELKLKNKEDLKVKRKGKRKGLKVKKKVVKSHRHGLRMRVCNGKLVPISV